MSDSPKDREPAPEPAVQQAFDQAAERLDLRAERSGSPSRTIGIAMPGFLKTIDLDVPDDPPPIGANDDAEVEAALLGYLSLHPEDVEEHWRQFANDPFVVIGKSWLATVDEQFLRKWIRSDEYVKTHEDFPPYRPRQVQISSLQIQYIGAVRAAATFHQTEQFTNGQASAGNSAAILVKIEELGWRIVVLTKQDLVASPPVLP